MPSLAPYVPGLDSLDEICGWLGTFRERLRQARGDELGSVELTIQRLEARFQHRRAELS